MIVAGPGFLGYGAALLWVGAPSGSAPFYDHRSHSRGRDGSPQRRSSGHAQVTGLQADKVLLYARYQSTSKWEQVTMQPQPAAPASSFFSPACPRASSTTSKRARCARRTSTFASSICRRVKQIRVTYHYPAWTGIESSRWTIMAAIFAPSKAPRPSSRSNGPAAERWRAGSRRYAASRS